MAKRLFDRVASMSLRYLYYILCTSLVGPQTLAMRRRMASDNKVNCDSQLTTELWQYGAACLSDSTVMSEKGFDNRQLCVV